MKIQSINTFNIKRNYPEKETKTFQDKRQFNIQKSANEIQSNYNISFHGLNNQNQKDTDSKSLMQSFNLKPGKDYLIADDSIFFLGKYHLNLKSPSIAPIIASIKPKESIIFGREGINPGDMDSTVSPKHLKISKDKNGQLIAEDIGSTYGTCIINNITQPNTSKGSFKLLGGKKYFLPINSILSIANCPLYLSDYTSRFDKMKDGDTITAGRSSNCSIRYNDEHISGKHLSLEKFKDGIIVTDLHSTNGTTFQGLEDAPLSYQDDYSNITTSKPLIKNRPTLLPKNSQLYLGHDFTIDTRNKNITDLLNKKGKVLIGRNSDCDLSVDDFYDKVSRLHLLLEKHGDDIIATNLNSYNQTIVVPQNEIRPFYGNINQINFSQGNIGDCYLLSTLYSISRNEIGAEILSKMVTVDKQGNYLVKFNNYPTIYVRPDELDGQKNSEGKRKISVSGDLGIKAIERAYAKMIKSPCPGETMFMNIDDGGCSDNALEKLTGIKSVKYNPRKIDVNALFNKIDQKGIRNHILTCSTPNIGLFKGYVDIQLKFISGHSYAIDYIDAKNQKVGIVNPYNTHIVNEISWKDFKKYFDELYVAET